MAASSSKTPKVNIFHRNGKNSCVFLFLVFLTVLTVNFTNGDSLYPEDPNVITLDHTNFSQTIVNSNHSWVVEFYASWCGHCQRLAPTWRAFAADIKEWNSVIKVAAIACSDEVNTAICRQHNIWGYPTVRFIPPYASAGYDGEPYRGRGTVEEFREATVEFLEGLQMKPHHWPRITPIESLQSYSVPAAQGKMIFVLFEDIGDPDYEVYTGREVVMDFSAQQILATIVRMDKAAADKLNIGGLPVLYRLMPDMRLHRIAEKQNREGFRTAIQQAITQHAIAAATTVLPTTTPEVTTTTSGSTTQLWMPTIGVYMQDLEAGLHYSLWVEVGSHRNIGGPALTALKDYVDMLAKYFPGSPNVRAFLQKADSWLKRRRGSISGTIWRRKFERLKSETAYIPSTMRWQSCAGSQAPFRGYPCALWTIFHTLTVAAYNKHATEEDFDPKEVLTSVRDYVQNFLGCRECAQHFVQMAASIVNVTDTKDVVMWLWRAHNKVNKRLAGDITEDPRHPKVQFPTIWMCPTCRTEVNPNTQEIIWNESEVLEFLRRFYGEHYIIQIPWTPEMTTKSAATEAPDELPKLRTAPPPVTLQRLPSDRQDSVMSLHQPNIRVHNRGPNRISDNGQTDYTTPQWVAPLDQRGSGQPDRTATNPFSPDFPQRGRFFDPHANEHGRNHEEESVDSTTTGTEGVVPTIFPSTTIPTLPTTETISTTPQPPAATLSTTERQRLIVKANITLLPQSTPAPVRNQYPQSQTTRIPVYDQRQTNRQATRRYVLRLTTQGPDDTQHRQRHTQHGHNSQPQQTPRPHYPQHTQRPYLSRQRTTQSSSYPHPQTRSPYYQPSPTQSPYYRQYPQPQTPRPYHQPQPQTQNPYYQPYPQTQTPRPYYQQNPQPHTQRPQYPQYERPQVTPRPHLIHRDNGLISHIYSHNHRPSKPVSTAIGRPRDCTLSSTPWSTCSKSCGAGMSTRYSNDNPRCRMEMEMRICKIRPCNMAFREHVRPGSCGATFRAVWEEPIKYGSCSSLASHKWHYCGTCPGMCCRPVVEDTNWMTFICENGEMTHEKFMRIKLCRCLPGRC